MLHASHKTAGCLPRCAPSVPARPRLVRCRAVYNPPSSSTAASELDLLKSWSVVVPDAHDATSITPAGKSLFGARAATVSASTISSIVAAGSLNVSPAYQTAITAALNFDRCKSLATEAERAQCKLDKATVNVGTLFSKEVEGRVCTKVSPTLHNNADAMVAKVHALLGLYKENGVSVDKLIFELPATWAGIQAAKQCEAKGVPTQITLVYSMTQAVAAAQAGASVIKVSVGRVREWYTKYPNALRDPHGPRQDAGYMSSVDPGVALVQQMYNYIKKYHPKTKLLVSGLRSRDDVMACSGADFLLVPTKVLTQLALTPTTAGYNDGLHAAKSEDEADAPTLSPNAAEHSNIEKMPAVTEEAFVSGMDMVATDLLKQGLKQQVADAERLLPLLEKGNFSASF